MLRPYRFIFLRAALLSGTALISTAPMAQEAARPAAADVIELDQVTVLSDRRLQRPIETLGGAVSYTHLTLPTILLV